MKKVWSVLSVVLTIAMLIGIVPVSALPVSAEETLTPLVVSQWTGADLAQIKQAGEDYTVETVGVREAASESRANWYWVMFLEPQSTRADGSKLFTAGSAVKFIARYNTDATYTGGNFDMLDATTCGGPSAYITEEMFNASPVKTDPIYGYTYREVTVDMGTLAADIDSWKMHLGLPTTAGRHTVELYGLSMYVDNELVWDCEGDVLAESRDGDIGRENIANATGKVTGIKTTRSPSPSDTPKALVDLDAGVLPFGQYALDVNLRTYGIYGDVQNKVKVTVSNESGVIHTATYTHQDVLDRLFHEKAKRYDTWRVNFEIPQDQAGQAVQVKIERFNGTDLYLRDVTLSEFANEQRVAAMDVIEAIEAIGEVTEENFVEKLALIEAAEAKVAAYVETYDQQTADDYILNADTLTAARNTYEELKQANEQSAEEKAAILEVENAIKAIPSFAKYSYRLARSAIEDAQAKLAALAEQYGNTAAEKVSNLDTLNAAVARMDYLTTYMGQGYKETAKKFWKGTDMTPASEEVTPYTTEVIGMREAASDSRQNWYWLMHLSPPDTYNDGSTIFVEGSELQVLLRVSNSDSSYDGSRYFEMIDTHGTDGDLLHRITFEEYEEAPELIDPIFGYTYKEVMVSMGILAQTYEDLRFHIGANTLEGRHTVEIYYFGVYLDGILVWDCEGEELSKSISGDAIREPIPNETEEVTGLSAVGSDVNTPIAMVNGITETLDAGTYAYDIELKTFNNEGVDGKVRFSAVAEDGTVLSSYDYTRLDITEELHEENSKRYDKPRFYVTVDEAHAGQEITLQVENYGFSEVRLRSVQLVGLMNQKQEKANLAKDAIDAIGEVTAENFAELKTKIDEAQSLVDDFVERYSQEDAENMIGNLAALAKAKEDYQNFYDAAIAEKKQQDTAALIAAIDAIGEVTQENYKEKLASIEAAEQLRFDFIDNYGEEAVGLITNDGALMMARSRYNELVEAEIQVTYGDIDGDGNINAADALKALQHAVKLVTLEGDVAVAADVDSDEKIDAKDALLILQYTVKLISSFPAENASA